MTILGFFGWLSLRIWDALTPQILLRELIGKNPVPKGCFLAGFSALLGLMVHAALTVPPLRCSFVEGLALNASLSPTHSIIVKLDALCSYALREVLPRWR